MHESSRKTALWILCIAALQQLVPMVATLYVPCIEKYIITRRGTSETDLFRVVYSNSNCPESECESSGANVFHSVECRCTCKPEYPTFLSELGKCSDAVTVKKTLFKSSSGFFEWPFFLRSLDLEREGYKKGNIEDYHSCHVVAQSAAYYNFQVQNKWVAIHGDIFNIAIERNQTVFQWTAVKNKELLGRIILVNISCSYSQSDSRPSKTACLVFKASGQITYTLHGVMSPLPSSTASLTAVPSSSLSSVTSPQLSTQRTSVLLHPSSSLPSPQPHQTKFVSRTSTSIQVPVTILKPSESSSAITASSSSVADITGNGPENKDKKSTGDGSNKVMIIGAAGGGAVVLVVLITIIVSCKRRKLRASNNETTTNREENDIQLGRAKGNNLTTTSEQDSDPTYQALVTERGQMNGVALHSTSKDTSYSYDNFTVYQSLDQKAPETSVYQSLKKGEHATGQPDPKPRPSATGHLSNRAKVMAEPRPSTTEHLSNRAKVIAEPVYVNGIKLPDTEQGNMPEPLYNVLEEPEPESQYEAPKRDHFGDTQDPLYNVLEESGPEKDYGASESENHGDTQDPLYNVLEGPEAEESNYEFQDVGSGSIEQEPMYVNVLKGPETEQATQEPLYTGLESSDGQNGCPGTRESLYSALEGPVSDGANKSGVDLSALKLPFYLAAFDNPAYDESLEPDVGYGVVVRKPGPKTTCKRESVYKPLRGPDLYQALRKSTA